jgi:transposase-like protein
MPYPWLDATYVKCRREGHVASTAIGCDERGWRHVLGVSVVDTEFLDSWAGFLKTVKDRGHPRRPACRLRRPRGPQGAIAETFQGGTAWQRCVVHLERDCVREAASRQLKRRVARIVAPIFRARDADVVRAAHHVACDMLEKCCPKAAKVMEKAEPDALAYLDFLVSYWKRLRADNVQERTNHETGRRSRVVQVFPSAASLERLAGAVMCGRRCVERCALLRRGQDRRALRRGQRGRRARRADLGAVGATAPHG